MSPEASAAYRSATAEETTSATSSTVAFGGTPVCISMSCAICSHPCGLVTAMCDGVRLWLTGSATELVTTRGAEPRIGQDRVSAPLTEAGLLDCGQLR